MLKESALIETQYFPPIQTISKCLLYSSITIEQYENYRKGTYRNRTHIASANGLLRLSIPLKKGKNQRQPIREVRISYEEAWQNRHWTAICSAYGNAPFFDYYSDYFKPFFKNRFEFLFDFNLAIFEKILSVLQIETTLQFSDTFLLETNDQLKDLRNVVHPRLVIMDEYFQIENYSQVFQEKTGFLPNLSVLDLIFCKGPEAIISLENSMILK